MKANWNPLDEPTDKVIMAHKPTPGLADIVGANSPRDWDEMRGYALSGARLRFRGIKLCHFSVKLRLYTTQDFDDWLAFKPIVDKPPLGRLPRAIDVSHPILIERGIGAAVVEDLIGPDQTDDGEWTIEIKLIEFRKPKRTISTPEASAATPVDPIDQRIGDRAAQIAQRMAQ
jgi:hypothetical protein